MSYNQNLQILPDPSTDPSGPGFTSLSIKNDSPGMSQKLNSGATISVRFAGSAWILSIGFPQLNIVEGKTIIPFLEGIGVFDNFYVRVPTATQPASGAWDVSTLLKRAEGYLVLGSTARKFDIPDYSIRGGTLAVGDYIKFTNMNKIYLITGMDLNVDVMSVTLNSEITNTSLIASAGLEPNDIKFRVKQTSMPEFNLNTEGLYASFNITLRENIL